MRSGVVDMAADQFNRISRRQLRESGWTADAIKHRISRGELVIVESGVLAIAPALTHDPWGKWMSATLTHPGSVLSHIAAAVAWGILSFEESFVSITRPGNGGPRLHGAVMVHRSETIAEDTTDLDGIPITSVPRTLLDLAAFVSEPALARAVREAVRLELVTLVELGDSLGRYRGRRGVRRLAKTIARYSGLPLERARSGAEVRALEILRDADSPMPRLNYRVAGEEADLSWPRHRLIVEIDGDPFHLDKGEDARKEKAWRDAGWVVERISSDDVYDRPRSLLDLTPSPNVPE